MKIQYASDLHLEFKENRDYLKNNPLLIDGDILVLAGDIGYLGTGYYSVFPFWDWVSENYKKVIVVLGNHEFYNFYELSSMKDDLCGEIRHNVHYYYNAVVHVDNVDFIISTLWSHINFKDSFIIESRVNDFRRIRYGKKMLHYADFNKEHDRCLKFIKKAVAESIALYKIVITHYVPSYMLLPKEFKVSELNCAFIVELSDYIESSDINYWIYGHSHRNIDAVIGKTKCVSNQLGYVFANEHHSFMPDKKITIEE